MRLYTGASLSTIDLLSDVYMIYYYATTDGQHGTALGLAIMVGLCLLGQLSLVWVQTHKRSRRVMIREMIIVLSGMKPGIDAKRVADGNEHAEHAAFSPDVELTGTRCFELVCESIPGACARARTIERLRGSLRANSFFFAQARFCSSPQSSEKRRRTTG
jgi:hypothetical protein